MAESFSKRRGLPGIGTRLLAAAVLLPVVIYVILRGGWAFFLLTALWVMRLVWEFDGMRRAQGARTLTSRKALIVLAILAACWLGGIALGAGVFVLAVGLFMGSSALHGRIEGATERTGVRVLQIFYLGLLPGYWLLLRELPPSVGLPYAAGGHWFLYVAGLTWIGDTFAYIVGSLIGRHSLGSAVSPKKSIEGALGGLAGSLLSAWLLMPYWAPFLELWQALLLGLLVAVAGQAGDLFESLLKRDAAIKDSSNIIPGHGGFLDRIDSLLFSVPVFYYFLLWAIF